MYYHFTPGTSRTYIQHYCTYVNGIITIVEERLHLICKR